MATHVEDIRVGHFVTITEDRFMEAHLRGFSENPITPVVYDGIPMEVLAVELPFILVTNGARPLAIDVRRYTLTRVSWRYARAFGAALTERNPRALLSRIQRKGKKKKKAKAVADPMDCPRCGRRRVQRLREGGSWEVVCPDCDTPQRVGPKIIQ